MRHAIPFSISFLKLTTNRDFFSLMLSTFMGELRLMVGAAISYEPQDAWTIRFLTSSFAFLKPNGPVQVIA